MRRLLISTILAVAAVAATAIGVGASSWPSGCC